MIEIILYILLGVLVLGVLPTLAVSGVVYTVLLVRTKPEKWGRSCSMPSDPELAAMYAGGRAWHDRYADRKRSVEVVSDGLRLAGEYFDFGGTRAVVVVPGRTEACEYSYYFAEPYRRAGYNVLAIDNRAHGLSEGRVNSLGFREYRDLLAWCRLLHDTLGNADVVLHGICIGSSTSLFALTAKECPDYVRAMVAEGMYVSFYESCRNHMLRDRRPVFPFLYEVMLYTRVVSGANAVTDGPLRRIGGLRKPILFLHSREDVFSRPEKAALLYDACRADKELVWFSKGGHSRIRVQNPEAYDGAVADFIKKRGLIEQGSPASASQAQ